MLSVLASRTSSGTNLALLEGKRVHSVRSSSAPFCVLLGGEFLHGFDTRWKLSWRYELAGSFPVRRPGVNQGMSQQERPLLPYLLLLFFFFLLQPLSSYNPSSSREAKKYTFSSPPPFSPF